MSETVTGIDNHRTVSDARALQPSESGTAAPAPSSPAQRSRGRLPDEVLGLRAGEWVEVRGKEEILATLDERGCLDSLPFMPEMLQYCGQRFRVYRRADKTCDTIGPSDSRRMLNAVHLEGVRCDGAQHGGCQAACRIFWKEAWLKRVHVGPDQWLRVLARRVLRQNPAPPAPGAGIQLHQLYAASRREDPEQPGEVLYVCQATELSRATSPLRWWDPRQYIRELWTRNVDFRTFVRTIGIAVFNAVQRRRGGLQYPYVEGKLEKTPSRTLGLQPGERVRVRSHTDIMATLNTRNRNRGLWFDVEMVPFCGTEQTVLGRVERIVDENTGRMLRLPGECIVLDRVECSGCLSRKRLFCPRGIYPYWREIWLERVEGGTPPAPPSGQA